MDVSTFVADISAARHANLQLAFHITIYTKRYPYANQPVPANNVKSPFIVRRTQNPLHKLKITGFTNYQSSSFFKSVLFYYSKLFDGYPRHHQLNLKLKNIPGSYTTHDHNHPTFFSPKVVDRMIHYSEVWCTTSGPHSPDTLSEHFIRFIQCWYLWLHLYLSGACVLIYGPATFHYSVMHC